MLRRTSFARKVYVPPPPAPLCALVRRPSYAGSGVVVAVPKMQIVRSEPYRRLVAALPCIKCGREGYSQAAHVPPSGKSMKQSDLDTFPLCCTRMLEIGCHVEFDQYIMFDSDRAREQGAAWAAQTRARIIYAGLWPANLPMLETESP